MKTDRLSAWTLPEILIVMVLTGLILMAALDGLDLVRRMTLFLRNRADASMALMSGYQRMDLLFRQADSLRGEEGGCRLFRQGEAIAGLNREGGNLVCIHQNGRDTLLRSVVCLEVSRDTLFLRLSDGDRELSLDFHLLRRPQEVLRHSACEQENEFKNRTDDTDI